MRAYKRLGKEGFTLVELMIVVAIIGVLAALAIYGVTRYFASAKTAEAKNTVGAISRSAAAAFEREKSQSQILAPGGAGTVSSYSLCGTATNKIPQTIPGGNKINPDPADQVEADPANGWTCLRFSMTQPILYQYYYEKDGNSATSGLTGAPAYAGSYFEASAKGDIDNDTTTYATFARGGQIQADGSLTIATQLFIDDEYE